jgi:hypothetical protein
MAHNLDAGFFAQKIGELRAASALGPIVDLACGRGRHALAGARAGLPMIGLDRNAGFLAELESSALREGLQIPRVRCDLEAGCGLPLRPARCGAIVVSRYLHRPLARAIVDSIAPGGWLLYETFSSAQPGLGWGPSNPDFLLQPGEITALFDFDDLEIIEHAEGLTGGERPAAVARLAARRR